MLESSRACPARDLIVKLIVGLGNPGEQYTFTRHNLGFLVLDDLAVAFDVKFKKSAVCDGLEAKVVIDGVTCSLLKPVTFMNLSGNAVKQIVGKKDIALSDILVVTDDLALPFGQMRIRPEGTDGGHNGLTSIIEQLGSAAFARLRMGISRPKPGVDTADYVLANFTAGERKLLPDFINNGRQCVVSWATKGVTTAMQDYNKREGGA